MNRIVAPFNVGDDVVYTAGNGNKHEATVKKVNGDGTCEIYEWDRQLLHAAKAESLSPWSENAV